MKAKYVVIRNTITGEEIPYIFPCNIVHKKFVCDLIGDSQYYIVISAGFVASSKEGVLIPFGESVSLNLSSRSFDIKLFENLYGE